MDNLSDEGAARYQDLVKLLQSIPSSIFNPFEIHRTHYMSSGVPIGTDIIIPRTKTARKTRPVIVRIHGGFLITGSSLFPAWFSKWILDFAALHGAIIISPNYRLLPEVKGQDIINDMRAFWTWIRKNGPQEYLASIEKSDVAFDIGRLLLIGESAGGYLALQSVLSRFVRPQAMITLYPMLDMRSSHYTQHFVKPICGVPNFPNNIVNTFLSETSGKDSITEADPPSRLDVALAVVQNGRFVELLGDKAELFVLERLETSNLPPREAGESLLPPLFILHGEQDSAVPIEGTLKFLSLLRGKDPQMRVHVAIRPGDHGFDATATINDEWMKDGLDFISAKWIIGCGA